MIPIALSAGTVMAVFLMAVIVIGYVVIWAIWHFFFREAADGATGERRPASPENLHDSPIREPLPSADRSPGGSAGTGPQATPRAAQDLGPGIGDGEASTGSRAAHVPPADGSDVPRVARHSASSGEDDRQA